MKEFTKLEQNDDFIKFVRVLLIKAFQSIKVRYNPSIK